MKAVKKEGEELSNKPTLTAEPEGTSRLMKWGILTAIAGIISPFIILIIIGKRPNIALFNELGTVGDYFGGTMVGLLSFSSILFVTAAIFMQKEELKLQREELSRVTDEYALTNMTMKKQQFESTFFNMINLHQTILANLKRNEVVGRELITILYTEFKTKALKDYREYKFKEYLSEDEIDSIFYAVYPIIEKDKLHYEVKRMFEEEKISHEEFINLSFDIDLENDSFDNYPTLRHIIEQHPKIFKQIHGIDISLAYELTKLPQRYYSRDFNEMLSDRLVLTDNSQWDKVKKNSYEVFYKEFEYIFGHYYRNLYRIIKYVNESDLIDDISKKEFRGILRAQLSTNELMMLFYNVVYSEKGEKFKKQLQNKNFFDDHLIIEEFVWNDDMKYLLEIK